MLVGLISDTHIPEAGPDLPAEVLGVCAHADLILHAGDIHDLAVLDRLQQVAPVCAARGNGEDGSGHRGSQPKDPRLRRSHQLVLDGVRIGLVHSVPLPERPPDVTLEHTIVREFGAAVDVIVCGDTHVESVQMVGDVLVVNPGSPTLPHNLMPRLGTVGLLEVAPGRVTARIVPLWNTTFRDYSSPLPPRPADVDPRIWRGGGPWWGQWTNQHGWCVH